MLSPNAASQLSLSGRVSTIERIFSVIERNVCPSGVYSGAPLGGGDASLAISLRLQLGVGVAQRRQVGGARARVEVGEQTVAQGRLLPRPHRALPVVDVAEDDRLRRAGGLARR